MANNLNRTTLLSNAKRNCQLRFTDSEFQTLLEMAASEGFLSVPAYIRHATIQKLKSYEQSEQPTAA